MSVLTDNMRVSGSQPPCTRQQKSHKTNKNSRSDPHLPQSMLLPSNLSPLLPVPLVGVWEGGYVRVRASERERASERGKKQRGREVKRGIGKGFLRVF